MKYLVKLTFAGDKTVKLEEDSYSGKKFSKYHSKIKNIELESGAEIAIFDNPDSKVAVFQLSNNTHEKISRTVEIKLTNDSLIIVSRIFDVSCDDDDIKWDFIIVGLGAAGSIVAEKLSRDRKTKVLVIEAGSNHEADPVILDSNWPARAQDLLFNPKYAVIYPVPTQGFDALLYSEGRAWGGSAAHNFLLAVRGTKSIYDKWAQISGEDSWLYKNLLPLMKELETYTGSTSDAAQHGFNGKISVTQFPSLTTPPPINPFLKSLSSVTNSKFIKDYNVSPGGDIGISAVQELITPGTPSNPSRRSYSALDFLPVGIVVDAKGNGLDGRKLKIISNAKALRFLTEKSKAKSVEYVLTDKNNNNVIKAFLKRDGLLILSGGSVQTPKLLLNSGIGPAKQLASVGIPVVVDSQNVGQNLQDQYGPSAIIGGGTVPFGAEAFITGFPYITPDDSTRRMQIINIPIGNNLFQSLLSITNPRSRGSVTIVDNNLLVNPKLDVGIYNDSTNNPNEVGSDSYLAVSFFKIIKKAVDATPGLFMIFPPSADYPASEFPDGTQPNDNQLFVDAQNKVTLQSHIVGTARMGKTILDGVVDGQLNVFGLKNVKIVDASVEPETVDGNTCLSAYYIALNFLRILDREKC